MTDLTERLRKRVAEASELPWHLMDKGFGRDNSPTIYGADEDLRFIARFRDGPCFHSATPDLANAKLAVDAVNALPDLLTTLEALTQENARLKAVSKDHFRNAQRLAGEVAKRDVENARLREALEVIKAEAERENGGWVHLKRAIAVAARKALGGGDE